MFINISNSFIEQVKLKLKTETPFEIALNDIHVQREQNTIFCLAFHNKTIFYHLGISIQSYPWLMQWYEYVNDPAAFNVQHLYLHNRENESSHTKSESPFFYPHNHIPENRVKTQVCLVRDNFIPFHHLHNDKNIHFKTGM